MIRLTQKPSTENIDIRAVDFAHSYDRGSALIGEEFAYQIVLCSDSGKSELLTVKNCSVIEASIYLVRPEAVSWNHYPDADPANYFLNEPGVVYDRLVPLKSGDPIAVGPVPVVLWISFKTGFCSTIDCRFRFSSAEEEIESSFQLEILNCFVTKEYFRYCEHIYPTAIAKAHNLPLFCDEYWKMLQKYFKLAADHGVTDLLVPAFPTIFPSMSVYDPVQLITITKDGSDYRFNFDLLDTWMYYAFRSGIKNMVFPPLYPYLAEKQCIPWMQTKYDCVSRLFGEERSCFDSEYHQFICELLRKLINHLRELEPKYTFTFQLTDGITADLTEDYCRIRSDLARIFSGIRILDPVSDRALFDQELFGVTVLPLDKIESFLDAPLIHSAIRMDPSAVSSLADPLSAGKRERLRGLGAFCFEHNISSLYSRGFNYDDALGMYPTGALSLIYTAPNEPMASVRLKRLCFARQDIHILQLLRSYTSRERVLSLIRRSKNILELREAANRLLADKIK